MAAFKRAPDPVLGPHHKAFGFYADTPYLWHCKIYHDKAFKKYSLLAYFPTTGLVIYNNQRYNMPWDELARRLVAEQRNYLGKL